MTAFPVVCQQEEVPCLDHTSGQSLATNCTASLLVRQEWVHKGLCESCYGLKYLQQTLTSHLQAVGLTSRAMRPSLQL